VNAVVSAGVVGVPAPDEMQASAGRVRCLATATVETSSGAVTATIQSMRRRSGTVRTRQSSCSSSNSSCAITGRDQTHPRAPATGCARTSRGTSPRCRARRRGHSTEPRGGDCHGPRRRRRQLGTRAPGTLTGPRVASSRQSASGSRSAACLLARAGGRSQLVRREADGASSTTLASRREAGVRVALRWHAPPSVRRSRRRLQFHRCARLPGHRAARGRERRRRHAPAHGSHERPCFRTYGRMVVLNDRVLLFANPEDAAEHTGFGLQSVE
jgi:hypothetical protein